MFNAFDLSVVKPRERFYQVNCNSTKHSLLLLKFSEGEANRGKG